MRYRAIYFTISILALLVSLSALIGFGLKPSVDFTGGSLLEVAFSEVTPESQEVRAVLEETHSISAVQPVAADRFIIKSEELSNEEKDAAIARLAASIGTADVLRFETVGATVSQELVSKTVTAILLVTFLITAYIWYQFKDFKFGICAILAMFHDTLILLGSFSILGYLYGVEVDMLFVSAVLTTLSFSVHDTIVVYDRVRELRGKHPSTAMSTLVNTAVLETLSRSLNNSITIFIVLFSLVLLGGLTIRWFAVALLIGAIVGTYSSTFVAAPLLVVWENLQKTVKEK